MLKSQNHVTKAELKLLLPSSGLGTQISHVCLMEGLTNPPECDLYEAPSVMHIPAESA